MSPTRFCARSLTAAVVVLVFLSAVPRIAKGDLIMASVSGYVYLDVNKNDQRDEGDLGIRNALITLISEVDRSYVKTTRTDSKGLYRFILFDAPKGTFEIWMQCCTSEDGATKPGNLWRANQTQLFVDDPRRGHAVTKTTSTGQQEGIVGVYLDNGWRAENYDFGQYTYPVELVSKRLLVDWGLPQDVPPAPPVPIPEPTTLWLLLCGGVVGAGVILRRRRCA